MMSITDAVTLGDYLTLQRGITYKSSLLDLPGPVLLGLSTIQRDGGFRYDSLRTYGGSSPEKLILKTGDLYVSLKDVTQSGDLLGSVARVPNTIKEGRLTQDTVKLLFKDLGFPRSYIYWILRTPQYRDYCRKRATGTTNLGLARDDFLAYPFPKPAPKHLSLVNLLDATDNKIELNRQMNETLDALARAIFQSWFVDFDPVRAKAEGRDTGLPPEIAALFPDGFEEIDGREVPRGWEITTLVQSVQFVKGKKPDEISDLPLEGYEQQILIDTLNGNNPIYAKNDNCVLSSEDNVLMVMDGASSGRVEIGFKGVIGSTIAKLEIINEIITPPILFYYLKTKEIEIQENTTGTSIPHADRKRIEQFEIVIPNNDLFTKYSEFAGLILEKIQNNKRESRTLAQIRDALLPKLMNAEIRAEADES